jgi:hypothetical protein
VAILFHFFSHSKTSLISLDIFDIHRSHDFLLRIVLISLRFNFSLFEINSMIAGSISQLLVHIINHARGVIHIDVSITFQFFIAVILAQFHM